MATQQKVVKQALICSVCHQRVQLIEWNGERNRANWVVANETFCRLLGSNKTSKWAPWCPVCTDWCKNFTVGPPTDSTKPSKISKEPTTSRTKTQKVKAEPENKFKNFKKSKITVELLTQIVEKFYQKFLILEERVKILENKNKKGKSK